MTPKNSRPRGDSWTKMVRTIARQSGWRCHLCEWPINPHEPPGSPWRLAGDHRIPRSEGGSDRAENIAPAHVLCNRVRGTRPLADLPDSTTFRRVVELRAEERTLLGPRKPVASAEQPQRQLMPGEFVGGVDGTEFSPWTGEPLPVGARSYRNPLWTDLDTEMPFDARTGARRPGVEFPRGSGQYALR